MIDYKVLITTSGIGSRLGDLTKYTNKALVRIGEKPTIAYIIESYPKNTNFVITLGYYGQQIRDFLELAYPDRKFQFVDIDKYEGPGTSLGYSMLQAKDSVQCPFIYHACDTLTTDTIPPPERNWIGGFKGDDSTAYASWKVVNNENFIFNEKGASDFDYLHIGIIGIREYQKFWSALEELYRVSPDDPGLNDCRTLQLMMKNESKFDIIEFSNWLDIGNMTSLNHARRSVKDHFDNLDKIDESVFLFKDYVIKFFFDKEIVRKRVARAKILDGLVPKIEGVRDNFYRYSFVNGKLYSRVVTPSDFKLFLSWAKNNLWKQNDIFPKEDFKKVCDDFYHEKTLKRVKKFLEENNIKDEENIINGEVVPSIEEILSKIDFSYLTNAEQYVMHGDFILDNILKTEKSYCLIDWRQDFGGLIEVGDIYYDLAKLSHNLTVNHDIVNANQFTIMVHDRNVECDILRRNVLVECEAELRRFIDENGLDYKKVEILRGIIWLNMSPLHHYPFNVFLYYFGKLNLWKALNQK